MGRFVQSRGERAREGSHVGLFSRTGLRMKCFGEPGDGNSSDALMQKMEDC